MASSKQLQYQADPNKFDLVTHRWDNAGNLVAKNLYTLYIVEGASYYERPVNSGNLWYANNKPAGRVNLVFGTDGNISSKAFDFKAEHKEFVPPKTANEQLHYELEQTREQNAQLAAELEQIKRAQKPAAESPLAKAMSGTPSLTKKESQA